MLVFLSVEKPRTFTLFRAKKKRRDDINWECGGHGMVVGQWEEGRAVEKKCITQ